MSNAGAMPGIVRMCRESLVFLGLWGEMRAKRRGSSSPEDDSLSSAEDAAAESGVAPSLREPFAGWYRHLEVVNHQSSARGGAGRVVARVGSSIGGVAFVSSAAVR